MISYGTAAIMAGSWLMMNGTRIAQQYNIEVIEVVDSGSDGVKHRLHRRRNRDQLRRLQRPFDCGIKQKIAVDLAEMGVGRQAVNYKLRDWLSFSRQPLGNCSRLGMNSMLTETRPVYFEPSPRINFPSLCLTWRTSKPKGTPIHRRQS
ncbi:MAG: hypothetical protein R3C01_14470 [Planctomycetaceae bacterium]